jgi:hypothetical protein
MQQSVETPSGQVIDARPERPPNHLMRAIILLLLLVPLCLLMGASSFYTAWSILTGPPFRSESPIWMRALMELLKAVVAVMGFFMPIAALVQALKVNSEYDAGNYGGAEAASKSAAGYSRQSLIFLVLILIIMAADLLRYYASLKH